MYDLGSRNHQSSLVAVACCSLSICGLCDTVIYLGALTMIPPLVEFIAEELAVVPQAKKAWAAPRIILSEIEETEANVGAGADTNGSAAVSAS
jgi:hypothetical protein